MKIVLSTILISTILFSCSYKDSFEVTDSPLPPKSESLQAAHSSHLNISPVKLEIGSIENFEDPILKENYFGSFFDDHLSCYVIQNPIGKVGDASVDKVVLFYIDQVLHKKKYFLTANPIDQIKPSIKRYRIKSLKNELPPNCKELGNKACAELILATDQYQFSWKDGLLKYELYCWKKDSEEKYILTELQENYQMALRFAKFQLDTRE